MGQPNPRTTLRYTHGGEHALALADGAAAAEEAEDEDDGADDDDDPAGDAERVRDVGFVHRARETALVHLRPDPDRQQSAAHQLYTHTRTRARAHGIVHQHLPHTSKCLST